MAPEASKESPVILDLASKSNFIEHQIIIKNFGRLRKMWYKEKISRKSLNEREGSCIEIPDRIVNH